MMTDQQAATYREYVHRHAGIFVDVTATRIAQDLERGGIIDLPLHSWLAALVGAVGNVGNAIRDEDDLATVRQQVVAVAATAVAIADWLDRGAYVEPLDE